MGLKTLAAAAGGSILYRKFLHHPILTRGAAAPRRPRRGCRAMSELTRRRGDERHGLAGRHPQNLVDPTAVRGVRSAARLVEGRGYCRGGRHV